MLGSVASVGHLRAKIGAHSKVHSTQLWSDFLMQETARQYHRRSRRISIGQPVRLVPLIARGELFEEIGTTSNVSREGLYFLTKREHYQERHAPVCDTPLSPSPGTRRPRLPRPSCSRRTGRQWPAWCCCPAPVVGRRPSVKLLTVAPCSSGARSLL